MENPKENQQLLKRSAYPTIAQSWGIIGFTIVASFMVGLPLSILNLFDIEITKGFWALLGYALPIVLVLWFVGRRRKSNGSNRDNYAFKAFPAVILPLIFIVTISLVILIDSITGLVPMPEWLQEIFKTAFQPNIWGFLTLAIAAPLLEELLMRGVVLEGLLLNYSPQKAIIWSAIFFGVLHLNPWQFVAGFFSGCFMGWLYWKTDSLWPGIIVHFINNAICFALLIIFPDVDNISQLFDNLALYIGLLLLSILIIWIGTHQINKILSRKMAVTAS